MKSHEREVDNVTLGDIITDHLFECGIDAELVDEGSAKPSMVFVADKYGNKFIVTIERAEGVAE